MEKYRKDNQFYEDRYDRFTIEALKKLEKEIDHSNKRPLDKARINYNDHGAIYDQKKTWTVENWKREDEQKDSIIERYNPPPNRDCKACNVRMHFEDYMFLDNNYEVIFIYNCPKNKEHRKLYFNNGVEYIPKKRKCEICGGQLTTTKKRNKSSLVLIDKCNNCGNATKDEFDVSPEKPINEAERKKYCTDFIGSSTFMQDLAKIDKLKHLIISPQSEKDKEEEFEVSKIEKIKVVKLEERLKEILEKNAEKTRKKTCKKHGAYCTFSVWPKRAAVSSLHRLML